MTTGIRISGTLVRHLLAAVPHELIHAAGRLRGHYDCAIAAPELLELLSTEHHDAEPVRVAKRRPSIDRSPRH